MGIIRHIVNFQSFTPLPTQGALSGLGTLVFSIIKAEESANASGGATVELTFDGETEQGTWRVSRRPWGYNAVPQTWLVHPDREIQVKPGVRYQVEVEERGDGKGWRVASVNWDK
ncbi:hypothetical protein M427DRAFT_76016 [Gonapodya prolifera JEL478]|uniref:Uncharacterized protein n=1 Tax=Gonapodya prolifera (strain JEL478) TaxID=1344416 RepID=A0A138ZXN8_GONPJ|nr:hypothetical protein M427DRAFT_76016 [Gonapodya prolifera JEL478]|eukprot:KXS09065.1 hypothetical protein M427DRAFT_76016 [Gonapodya prolifera JEL478]